MKRLIAAAVALPAILTACAAADSAGPQCFSSADCPGGAQCVLGECTEDLPAFPVDMWLSPLRASEYLSQPVRDVTLGPRGSVDVAVRAPAEVEVGSSVPVKATLTATREDLPRPLSFAVEVLPDPGTTTSGWVRVVRGVIDGRSGDLDLLPYRLVALPLVDTCCEAGTACLAPEILGPVELAGDGQFVFGTGRSVRVGGRVVQSEENPRPVAGLQVQAFDPVTGVFSLATHTDDEGRFCVGVSAPDAGQTLALTLRLGPGETRPTVELPGRQVPAGVDEVELGDLSLGEHGPLLGPFHGTVRDASGTPVPATRLTFSGQADPAGTYTASTTTDAEGRWWLTLLRGTYEVRAHPPAESESAALRQPGLTVDEDAARQIDLSLPVRPVLTGTVLDPEGLPVAGVVVTADPEVPDPAGSATFFTATTDGSGRFRLAVDPGAWRLRFVPPEHTGLPWIVGRTVTAETGRLQMDLPPIAFEPPLVLPGRVHAVTGAGLQDFKVEVHARTPSGRSVLVWEARTDADGEFGMRLPRSLAGSFGSTP